MPSSLSSPSPYDRIYAVVSKIPKGRVATYGQVAALAGLPRRARQVGYALHALAEGSALPWHRVVNSKGTISPRSNALGHEDLQAHLLRREDVRFTAGKIPLARYRWQPQSSRPTEESIRIKRVYEPPAADDGARVLVDRLWPRAINKGKARLDAWLKELGPSTALRKWFDHDPRRWTVFRRRYHRELASVEPAEAVAELRARAAEGTLTLLFAAKDPEYNNAAALRDYLETSRTHTPARGRRRSPASETRRRTRAVH